MPTKSLMSLVAICLQFASTTAFTDFGPSRQCPLGSNSLVTVTDVEQRSNSYLIGQEGTILAHNSWGTPGYWIKLESSNNIKLFKCSDVEAVQPASCNSNTNAGCSAGYTCQKLLGSINGATSCVKNQDTCWMGPACNEKESGVPHASNYEMISNNCYDKKSMCEAHNQQPQTGCDSNTNTGCSAGYKCQNLLGSVNGATSCVKDNSKSTGCFANKGGMCVYLQQEPVLFGNDLCYTTKRQCKNSLNNTGYGSTLLGASTRKRSLRGLAATEPTATPTPATTTAASTYGSSNATSPVTIVPKKSTTAPTSSYSEIFQDEAGAVVSFSGDGSCTIDGVAGTDAKCQEYKTKADALTASLKKMQDEMTASLKKMQDEMGANFQKVIFA